MVGLIAAAAMVASFFLPWVAFFGTELGPVYFFDENAPPMGDYPWRVYAVLASFAFAALAVLCVVLRRRAGLVMLIAGGIPVGLIAEPILRGVDQIQDLPVEVPRGLPGGGDVQGVLDTVSQYIAIGLPMYLIAAVVLVLAGLVRLVRGT